MACLYIYCMFLCNLCELWDIEKSFGTSVLPQIVITFFLGSFFA